MPVPETELGLLKQPSALPSSRYGRWLRLALSVAVGIGVCLALWRLAQRWNSAEVSIHAAPLIVAAGLLVVANVLQAAGWLYLLERMAGRKVPARPALVLFMAGQLARYLPGKLGVPMVRMAGASRIGVSARLVAGSVGIEVLSWMGIGTLVGCAALLLSTAQPLLLLGTPRCWLWICLGVVISFLLASLWVDRRWLPQWVIRLLRAEGQGPMVPAMMLWVQLVSWIGWWATGILLSMGVGASREIAVAQAGVYILAPILGFLALVAPGGLGVRETVISYALAPHIGPSAALTAAMLARAAGMASEILSWALALVLERMGRVATGTNA
jgi:uncharacterized membrane protein YbhN (UPF0104 family)